MTAAAAAPEIALRLAASFTIEPLLPSLRFWQKEAELSLAIEVAGYGQLLQALLDPASVFNTKRRGLNVVLFRAQDWLRELGSDQRTDLGFVRRHLAAATSDLEQALRSHRSQAGAATLLLICPSTSAGSDGERALVEGAERSIEEMLGGVPGLQVERAASYHGKYEVDEHTIADPLREEIGHIPYRDEYFAVLATLVARRVHQQAMPARKVVVVDCDNTLWRGVVGEAGAEGVEFDTAHQALHRTLEDLARNGVLVCLCSKNEEADVWRVFETRRELLLNREHVVASMINWRPKSENIRTLAARLNLGLDSFIFIDDNPVECAEVRAGCPDVLTLEWPQVTEAAHRFLRHTWEFDRRSATKEDARRTELYREEFRRQELRAETLSFDDFIASLQLQVDIAPLTSQDQRRAAQLTLRTNQFNFTTIRREESEMQSLVSGGRHDVRTVRVRDRFGDYGLVGLVIAEQAVESWTVDTFLLSCRVLGRGVEHRILADLGERAAAAGAKTVRLHIDATRRNTPAREFLASVVPTDVLTVDDGGMECELPVDTLAAVRFEPATAAVAPSVSEGGVVSASSGMSEDRLRRREQQIVRAFTELATATSIHAAVAGPLVEFQPVTGVDITETVCGAFSTSLRIPVERVREIDRLEALGCDSLRIVAITVALKEPFPWLPSTLLFEHRSVSEIVRHIRALAGGSTGETDAQVPSPSVEREAAIGNGDIAVVGMHVRCAGVESPEALWDLLKHAGSAVRPVSTHREHFLKPLRDTRPHWAGLLDDVARFDPELFGVSPREAEFMDPQLRLFLEVAWNALEDAGCLGAGHDRETGVFAGVMYGDYGYRANEYASTSTNPYRCWEGFSLANRLSQLLGFDGPSLAVDTACSSSGTAIHLACNALRAGDCQVAIAGGVNLILDPDRFGSLGRLGILSARGRCEPFGADADGTVLGEGAGVVVLRSLDDALRRGDRIYGVIKGTGVSTGHGTVGFTAPNPQAQATAIRRSLALARFDPRTVTYVETHGTGTALGDPIEVRGLTLGYDAPALQDPSLVISARCRMGSIKPNIGHLEAGAGVLGLIKVLLQFQHGMLLPSITSPEPNPQIAFAADRFEVQRELEPWHRAVARVNGESVTIPRRAGLSSFGVGGANAHILVEEAPAPSAPRANSSPDRSHHVITLSARSEAGLGRQISTLRQYLESPNGHATDVADLGFTFNTGRKHFEHRVAFVAATAEQLRIAVERGLDATRGEPRERASISGSRRSKLAFLFTGQGSQYAGMGHSLYETHAVFRAALARCAAALDSRLDRPLLEVMFAASGSADAELLNQTGYTQPALFALEYSLSELWRSWGLRPDFVMGHSVGEIAAMCVAGGLSFDDAIALVAARGRLMQALPAGGAMTSIVADEARITAAIAGYETSVSIAAINAPGQVVISGTGTAVAEISARLAAEGAKTKELLVSHAFHSPLMQPMLVDYERVVRSISFSTPVVPFVSSVTGTPVGVELTRPEYWLRNVTDPVRFCDGMRALEAQDVAEYLEVGPHPVLLGMGRQCVSEESAAAWSPSLRKDADCWLTLLGSLSKLYIRGATVDWSAFDAPYRRARVSAPVYEYARRQYWLRDLRPSPQPTTLQPTGPERLGRSPSTYEIAWRPQPMQLEPRLGNARWLILADNRGFAARLSDVLLQDGATVDIVRPGDRFARSPHGWTVNPQHRDDFNALCRAVTETNGLGVRVVDFWSLDLVSTDSWDMARALEERLLSATYLVQSLAETGLPHARLWFVTNGAVCVDSAGNAVSPIQAMLWGFGRTASLEHPELWGGLLDIATEADLEAVAREIAGGGLEDQIAFRDGGRFVARLVERPHASAALPKLSADGTYLVTGGTGALGVHVASWLVERGARRLVLASRRGELGESGQQRLRTLQNLGAHITIVKGDVSEPRDVDGLLTTIADSTAPLRGIVHAAGVDQPTPLRSLTPSAIRDVVFPKALGAWLLHERTQDAQLDLAVYFSSVASVVGAHGRAHYAAANAFLDGLAAMRRGAGYAALAVNWGPWSGGGMATGPHLEQFERVGNHGLAPAAALAALNVGLASGAPQVMVADIDWATFIPVYESRRQRPFISEVAVAPPAREAALQPAASSCATNDRRSPAASESPWSGILAQTPAPEWRAVLTGLIRAEVANTLGFDSSQIIPPDKAFTDLGMDSLLSVEMSSRLRTQLGVSTKGLVFQYPSIEALVEYVLTEVVPAPGAEMPVSALNGSLAGTAVVAAGYEPAVEPAVFAFQAVAWPRRDRNLIPRRWRWMYVDSARRLKIEPRIWLHRDQGQVVAHMGSIPVRLKIADEERLTGWLVETMVLKSHRQLALGSRLMVEAHEEQPFSLSLGQTHEMRTILHGLGWRQVATLQVAQRLARPANVLRGKLPAPAAWAASIGIDASNAVRSFVRDRARFEARLVDRFGERHDRLWEGASSSIVCGVVRDSSYLNWKYVCQPGQEFMRLEFLDGGEVKAVVIWTFREPDATYKYRRALLVDLVAPFADRAALREIVDAACAAAIDRGADALVCMHTDRRVTEALRSCGFRLREPSRYLWIDPGDVSGPALNVLLSPDAWFVTQGDSDIDRP